MSNEDRLGVCPFGIPFKRGKFCSGRTWKCRKTTP